MKLLLKVLPPSVALPWSLLSPLCYKYFALVTSFRNAPYERFLNWLGLEESHSLGTGSVAADSIRQSSDIFPGTGHVHSARLAEYIVASVGPFSRAIWCHDS